MGSGKSTTGKLIAEKLGYPFADLDSLIESDAGKSIESIFASEGEQAFRIMEREMLEKVLSFSDAVVAVGGGAPCYRDNMELMNRSGRTIYLKMSVEGLVNRLDQNGEKRPLISGMMGEELEKYVRDLLKGREKYYSKAHHTVNADDLTIANLLSLLS